MLNRFSIPGHHALLIFVCMVATLGASVHADVAKAEEATTLAYTSGRGGTQLIKVIVNRTATATFMFDSGTNYSCVSDTLVKRLKLKPFVALTSLGKPMPSFGLREPAQGVLLPSVAIGDVNVLNSPFIVLEARSFSAAAGQPVDGLLGANFAAKFPILLDFQKRELTIFHHSLSSDDLKRIGMDDTVCVSVKDVDKSSHFKFPITVKNGEATVEGGMMLDTGSNGTHVAGVLADQLHLKPQGRETVSTLYGSVSTADATVSSLQFGAITLNNLAVSYVDRPETASTMDDNILGLDVLSHFKVLLDYPNDKIYFLLSPPAASSLTPLVNKKP